MRIRQRLPSVLVLLMLPALLLTAVASASPPQDGGGTFTNISTAVTPVREADGNLILEITFSDTLSGTFTGIATGNLTCVVKSTGEGTCHGTESFTGTVCVDGDCRSGTLVFRDAVKLDGASVEGHFATSSGTGGLEDLHAVGTFQGAAGAGTYTTQGHFDPK